MNGDYTKKGCYGNYQAEISRDRKCHGCCDFPECTIETITRSNAVIEKPVAAAVKLDNGKRKYSLIIPQMMEVMLPKLDKNSDGYWVRQAVLELSNAAHKNNLGDILMYCHGAIEGLRLHIGSEKILDELTKAMEYGAKKPEYGRNNWKKGMEWSRLLDAGMRHGIAILRGEDIDRDSGNTHLAHMLGSIHMLMGNIELGVGTDDITTK